MYRCNWCGREARKDTRIVRALGMCQMKFSAIVVTDETPSFSEGMLWLCPPCVRALKKAVEAARKSREP